MIASFAYFVSTVVACCLPCIDWYLCLTTDQPALVFACRHIVVELSDVDNRPLVKMLSKDKVRVYPALFHARMVPVLLLCIHVLSRMPFASFAAPASPPLLHVRSPAVSCS